MLFVKRHNIHFKPEIKNFQILLEKTVEIASISGYHVRFRGEMKTDSIRDELMIVDGKNTYLFISHVEAEHHAEMWDELQKFWQNFLILESK